MFLHESIKTSLTRYPGGEVRLSLQNANTHSKAWAEICNIGIESGHAEELILAAQAADAFRRKTTVSEGAPAIVCVHMVYPSLQRDDRVPDDATSFPLRVYADLINSFADMVVLYDPHSDVAPAVFNNVRIAYQGDLLVDSLRTRTLVSNTLELPALSEVLRRSIFVCPDAGAQKKIHTTLAALKAANYITGVPEILYAYKNRDLATGKLSGFRTDPTSPCGNLKGRTLLILDDIIDGGGTFLGLAETLRQHEPKEVFLCASHAIFSQGLPILVGPTSQTKAPPLDGVYVASVTGPRTAEALAHPRCDARQYIQVSNGFKSVL